MPSQMRHGWIFDFITMLAVVTGVVYGAVELRNHREARDREAMLRLFEISQSDAFVDAVSFVRALPDTLTTLQLRSQLSGENRRRVSYLAHTWEGLGILTFRRQVPLEWVDEYYGGPILESWRKLRPLIFENRQLSQRDARNEWFQWLAERVAEYEQGAGDRRPAYALYKDWKPHLEK